MQARTSTAGCCRNESGIDAAPLPAVIFSQSTPSNVSQLTIAGPCYSLDDSAVKKNSPVIAASFAVFHEGLLNEIK